MMNGGRSGACTVARVGDDRSSGARTPGRANAGNPGVRADALAGDDLATTRAVSAGTQHVAQADAPCHSEIDCAIGG